MVDHSAVNILVLDDEPFMLKVILHMLGQLGFSHVATTSNGQRALHMLSSATPPNLILCDLNMPEMDGIEFIRKLVEQDYHGSLILVSGEDARVLETAARLARAHRIDLLGQLHKPVLPDELAQLIDSWRPAEPDAAACPTTLIDAGELRRAIANGELVNHYQPKVALASGRVTGVEALVRWQHPRLGLLMPDRFISVAEEHGVIDELTRWVVTDALAQAGRWADDGLDLRIAINLSMLNLGSLDLLDFMTDAAARHHIAPQKIILEVTESRLMQDVRAPLEILGRLRLRRFRLSIDDFGTGHSSFAQLRDIPFDELKIDRGFVRGAADNPTVRAIYQASLGLAKQLGLEVVAEGVEDLQDWNFVRASGCDLAQGYFIARPMPASAFPAWLAHWRATQGEWQ